MSYQKKLNYYHQNYLVECILQDDGFQNMFVYQPTFNTIKKTRLLNMLLVENQKEYIILNL